MNSNWSLLVLIGSYTSFLVLILCPYWVRMCPYKSLFVLMGCNGPYGSL